MMLLPAWSVVLIVCFTVVHLAAIPLIVSTDGRVYIELAEILFSDEFHTRWYSARTPLLPFSIHLVNELCGFGSTPILLMSSLYLIGGLLGSALIVAEFLGRKIAGIYGVAFAMFPPLVGYSHVLLPEVGIFFFFSTILLLSLSLLASLRAGDGSEQSKALAIGIALSVGYLFRQSLLYLLFPIITAVLYDAFFCRLARVSQPRRAFIRFLLIILFFIASPPLAVSRLWTSYAGDDINMARTVFKHGFIKQGVLPEEVFKNGEARQRYNEHLNGEGLLSLPLVGLPGSVTNGLYRHVETEKFSPMKAVIANPIRYVFGAIRTTLYYLGLPSTESQIVLWSDMAFRSHRTRVTGVHPTLSGRLAREGSDSRTARTFSYLLEPSLRLAWLLGSVGTISLLILSFWRRNSEIFLLSALPISFICMHSLTCFAVDRYILPIIPILFINFLVLVTGRWRKKS